MGCKFGGEKEEEKTEIKDVIKLLKGKDEKTPKKDDIKDDIIHDLEYYQKQSKLEQKGENEEQPSSKQPYHIEIFKILNEIRQKPLSYANFIEDCMDNIIETETGEKKEKKIIYEKGIKVQIKRGEPAFREAVKCLKNMDKVNTLLFENNLVVPLPSSESELNDKNYLQKQIAKIRESRKVDAYFKDMVKDPKISALLIVADAYGDGGKRRDIILDPDIKYVGISSGMVGDTFVSYFAFSS